MRIEKTLEEFLKTIQPIPGFLIEALTGLIGFSAVLQAV
jgi:hypothetical protein